MLFSRGVSVLLSAMAVSAMVVVVMSGRIVDARHADEASGKGDSLSVNEVAGFTKFGFTADHLVVVNVLPGEEMFTIQEVAEHHPTVGEMVLDGRGSKLVSNSRHVEAHIYDRVTGLPVTDTIPKLDVVNRHTGNSTPIRSVLMQDVAVGPSDIHFGDNVQIDGDTILRISVRLDHDEEVVIDGYLS